MERTKDSDAGELMLESILCKLGRKKWAGLAVQAPRSHVLPIDGVAMDLVVCLDRSKSMGRYWPIVIETLNKGVTKLTARDRLGIRTFAGQRHSQSILELTEMSQEGQDKALEAIKSIPKPSSGHTNLGAALEEGLDELLQNLTTDPSQPERAVRLLLYTDGKPTVGIRRLAELLEVREQKMTKLGPSAKVAVFAYGENHDVKVLKSICNNYSSLYFAVTDQNIVLCLGEFYGGTRTTFFRDLVLSVRGPRDCEVRTTFHCKSLNLPQADVRKWEIHIPDMQSSERRNVIIKIPESVRGGEVHFGLQYYSIVAKSMVTLSRTLDIVRDVSFDDGTKIAVGEQRNRMSSINVLRQAIASAGVHDWEEAQTLVAKQRRRIDHSIARNAPLTRQMSKQLEHYRETFRRRGRQQAAPGYIPPVRIGFREEAEMSAFCQSLEAERSSSAGIEQFQTLEKRAQTEVLMGELEPTLTLRRNETARRRAIARGKRLRAANRESEREGDSVLLRTLDGEQCAQAPHPTGYVVNTMVIQRREELARRKGKDKIENGNGGAEVRPVGGSNPSPAPQLRRSLSSGRRAATTDSFGDNLLSSLTHAPSAPSFDSSMALAAPSFSAHSPNDGRQLLMSSTPALYHGGSSLDASDEAATPSAPPPTPYTTPTADELEVLLPNNANGGGLGGSPSRIPQMLRAVSVRELFERQRQEQQAKETARNAKRNVVDQAFTLLAPSASPDAPVVSDCRPNEPRAPPPTLQSPAYPTRRETTGGDPHTVTRQPPRLQRRMSSSDHLQLVVDDLSPARPAVIQRVEPLPVTPNFTPTPTPGHTPESATGQPLRPADLTDFLQRTAAAVVADGSSVTPGGGEAMRRSGSDGFRKRLQELRQQRRQRQVTRHLSVDSLRREPVVPLDDVDLNDSVGRHNARVYNDNDDGDDYSDRRDRGRHSDDDDDDDSYSSDEPGARDTDWSWRGSADDDDDDDDSYSSDEVEEEEERTMIADVSDDEDDEGRRSRVLSPRDVGAQKLQALKQLGADPQFKLPTAKPPPQQRPQRQPPPPSLRPAGSIGPIVPLSELVAPLPPPTTSPQPAKAQAQARPEAPRPVADASASLVSELQSAATEGGLDASSSLRLSPADADALSAAVAFVVQRRGAPTTLANAGVEASAAATALPQADVSVPSSTSSTPYHTRTSLPFSLGSLSAYLQPDGEEEEADAIVPTPNRQRSGDDGDMDVKAQQAEEEQLTPSRRGSLNSSTSTATTSVVANSSSDVRVRTPSSTSSPQVPHARSSGVDLRQLIVHIDEADGGGSRVSSPASMRGRRDTVVLITLRSAATTLDELQAKIRAKFPGRGEVVGVGVWMGGTSADLTASGSNNLASSGWLIPIETDDDVEELIHGNVLRARFAH